MTTTRASRPALAFGLSLGTAALLGVGAVSAIASDREGHPDLTMNELIQLERERMGDDFAIGLFRPNADGGEPVVGRDGRFVTDERGWFAYHAPDGRYVDVPTPGGEPHTSLVHDDEHGWIETISADTVVPADHVDQYAREGSLVFLPPGDPRLTRFCTVGGLRAGTCELETGHRDLGEVCRDIADIREGDLGEAQQAEAAAWERRLRCDERLP